MIVPIVGLAGVGVAAGANTAGGSMAEMGSMTSNSSSGHLGGAVGVLVRFGPELLVVSVLLVVVSMALRRPLAAIPAAGAGALLYWGMHAQGGVTLMYVTLAVAYLAWVTTYIWARNRSARRVERRWLLPRVHDPKPALPADRVQQTAGAGESASRYAGGCLAHAGARVGGDM